MKSLEFYTNWLEHDGKTVTIDGIKHKIKVSTFEAIYPYKHAAITVYATPVNRYSKYYREIKKELRDDWSTDVLSSLEMECEILSQLKGK
jgi:hypothetical protein